MAASDPLFASDDGRALTGDTGGAAAPGDLEQRLGHKFANASLLTQALTHPSMMQVRPRGGKPPKGSAKNPGLKSAHYERLEFLGDRVLGLIVAEMLLDAFPAEAEGALARRHAQLVRKETLADVARALDLGTHIYLNIEEPGARDSANLLADSCEAIIAALYLDGGLMPARRLILRYWDGLMRASAKPPKDAKTALQEWTLARGKPMPHYVLVGNEGPPHQPIFKVQLRIDGKSAEGTGASKRVAETEAATLLLRQLSLEEH